ALFNQGEEHLEGLLLERRDLAVTQQHPLVEVDPETVKLVDVLGRPRHGAGDDFLMTNRSRFEASFDVLEINLRLRAGARCRYRERLKAGPLDAGIKNVATILGERVHEDKHRAEISPV